MNTITLKTKEEIINSLIIKKLEYKNICSNILNEIGEDKCLTREEYDKLNNYTDLYDYTDHELRKLEGREIRKNWFLKLLRL